MNGVYSSAMGAPRVVVGLVAALLLAGCGSSGSAPSTAASSSTPTATKSHAAAETESCRQSASQWLDIYKTMGRDAYADNLELPQVKDSLDRATALTKSMTTVCSQKLRQAAAFADYETALANGFLTACKTNPSKCEQSQREAGTHIVRAIRKATKVSALLSS